MQRSGEERFGKGTCFVVMGFGKKTDFESARLFDLDKTYHDLIKPAVLAAGLHCVRADEVQHSGYINTPLFEALLQAEFVIADLTTSNREAIYQLGVRHALKPLGTIVIADEGLRALPFDPVDTRVLRYRHPGEDLGTHEVVRFRQVLTETLTELLAHGDGRVDSPVYQRLPGLQVHRDASVPATATITKESDESGANSTLLKVVDDAIARGDLPQARTVLITLRDRSRSGPSSSVDPEILRRLAAVTYKSREPAELTALMEARDILADVGPRTSSDVETVQLWGRIHVRLWEVTADALYLDEAIATLKRGFHLRAEYRNATEYAFLLNTRAARATRPADAIADFVLARRVREQALALCNRWLEEHPEPEPSTASEPARQADASVRYWVLAAIAEARAGLQGADAESSLEVASAAAPEQWAATATRLRIKTLLDLVAESPLRYLRVA